MVKVYIDPGHGGKDPGALGNGLMEKNVTLAIGKKVRDYLINDYDFVKVRMSRTTDKTVALEDRVKDANKWGASVFISIHINSFNESTSGYEDYIHETLSTNSIDGQLQDALHEEIIKVNGLRDRGQKKADFHVLRESDMPSVLTENGFIDNAKDAAKMKQTSWINAVAKAHAKAIANYLYNQGDGKMKYRLRTGKFDFAEDLVAAKTAIKENFNWVLYEVPESLNWNPGYRIITGAAFNSLKEAEEAQSKLRDIIPGYAVYVIEA